LLFPGIDAVADAHRLPFRDEFFAGVVMLDVLHHLERPIEFLREASRVLKPGGRLAMIEPAMTALARRFYDRFHEEPVIMNADPFKTVASKPDRDPFDANQAIPTLLFATAPARRIVEQTVPSLRVRSVDWQSLLAYPMSGGFQKWSLIPGAMVSPMLAFERRLPGAVRRHLAFRMMVVLERV
jgi:SAM-dependent methyltransferase